jgi:uncharacterized membrane protein
MTIRNPVEWSADSIKLTTRAMRSAGQAFAGADITSNAARPEVRRIGIADLVAVLRAGFDDFLTNRTDVIFVCLIYPVVGLILAYVTARHSLLPLLFPLVSGFALIGPLAAVGAYEMSRRREQGQPVSWVDAFGVFRSPCIAQIVELGLLLVVIFLAWLTVAMLLYQATLGPAMPDSIGSLVTAVFSTAAGWTLLLTGVGIGCLFALVVLAISAVSFPLLLDRQVSISTAVMTSVRAIRVNPVPMLVWGLIVAASLVLGTIPALLGLIVVLPVLGHATWHLYRKLVA